MPWLRPSSAHDASQGRRVSGQLKAHMPMFKWLYPFCHAGLRPTATTLTS